MVHTLQQLSDRLNETVSSEGVSFNAQLGDDFITVACSNAEEFPVYLSITDSQILSVTPLFDKSEIDASKIEALHDDMLSINPMLPLSSIGKQADSYILFGAMALETVFENIVHELELQGENTLQVLETLTPYFKQ